MALLCIPVPPSVDRTLRGIDVPGDRSKVGKSHITVLYLGDASIDAIAKAMTVTQAEIADTLPFFVQTNHVSCFPEGEDGVPIICPIVSPPLHALRARLVEAFEEAEVSFSNKFPVYKPHVTLAYHDVPILGMKFDVPITWSVDELVLWGGNDPEGGVVITFPFQVPRLIAEQRVARRYAMARTGASS